MKFLWSIVLLASVVFTAATALFFGHGLIDREGPWFIVAAVCLLIGAALIWVQSKFRGDVYHAPHH
jgi:hypothetical protein